MTERSIVSYREEISNLERSDLKEKRQSLVEPMLQKIKEQELKEFPFLNTAYDFKDALLQLLLKCFPGVPNALGEQESIAAMHKVLIAFMPHTFDTQKFYLFVGKKQELNIRHELDVAALSEAKVVEIYQELSAKYSSLNKNLSIYKVDLNPEIKDGLLLIPLQHHEFPFILGFVALKVDKVDDQIITKAKFMQHSFWDTLRMIFDIPTK